MTKFKKRKEEQEAGIKPVSASVTERISKLFKKTKKKEKSYKKETSSIGGSSDDSPPSPTESHNSDDFEDPIFEKKFFNYATRANQKRQKVVVKQRRRRKNPRPAKNLWPASHFNLFADVVNDEQWRQRQTCCGIVYECAELQSIIVDASSFKPCPQHQAPSKEAQQQITKVSDLVQQQPNPPTAIKKHQLFLKRHEHPSITQCDNVINSSLTETSNKNKTELIDSTTTMKTDGDDRAKPFDKLRRINDIKMGECWVKIPDILTLTLCFRRSTGSCNRVRQWKWLWTERIAKQRQWKVPAQTQRRFGEDFETVVAVQQSSIGFLEVQAREHGQVWNFGQRQLVWFWLRRGSRRKQACGRSNAAAWRPPITLSLNWNSAAFKQLKMHFESVVWIKIN